MATTTSGLYPQDFQLHDHAGARWLAPFIGVFALTIGVMIAMLVSPYASG
ncbi:MAG: hypothetical protein HOV81_33365 [Kofleriaceae bacterium]|nr:hypothetical protein [Kofleriaceae bacterium]